MTHPLSPARTLAQPLGGTQIQREREGVQLNKRPYSLSFRGYVWLSITAGLGVFWVLVGWAVFG